jgi:uncharacterized RDD family membrane protein YckC
MEQIIVQPPPLHPQAAEYAGFWKRLLAYFIDKIIIGVASLIFLIPFFAIVGIGALSHGGFSRGEFDAENSAGFIFAVIGAYVMLVLLIVIAEWLYFSLMESKKGATLGKMAMNLLVTDLDGNRISFGRATGRFFGRILSGIILGVGYMMAGWTQQKQALHDILAGTLVVVKK